MACGFPSPLGPGLDRFAEVVRSSSELGTAHEFVCAEVPRRPRRETPFGTGDSAAGEDDGVGLRRRFLAADEGSPCCSFCARVRFLADAVLLTPAILSRAGVVLIRAFHSTRDIGVLWLLVSNWWLKARLERVSTRRIHRLQPGLAMPLRETEA